MKSFSRIIVFHFKTTDDDDDDDTLQGSVDLRMKENIHSVKIQIHLGIYNISY